MAASPQGESEFCGKIFQQLLFDLALIQGNADLCDLLHRFVKSHFQSEHSVHLLSDIQLPQSCPSDVSSALADLHTQVEQSEQEVRSESQAVGFLLGVPIYFMQKLIGSLVFSRPQQDFTEQETGLLKEFARLIAAPIESLTLLQQQSHLRKQLDLIASVISKLADISKLDSLAQEVCDQIVHSYGFYYVGLFTISPDGHDLEFRANSTSSNASQELVQELKREPLKIGAHLIGSAAQTGQLVVTNDVLNDPRYSANQALPETRAEANIPLKIGEQVIGVLNIQSEKADTFTQSDVLALSILADSVALAINRVRLVETLGDRNEKLSLIAEVTKTILGILDLEPLLNKIAELLHRDLGYPYVHIFLFHYVGNRIEFKAGSGSRASAYKEHSIAYDIDSPLGVIPSVARENKIRLLNDVTRDPLFVPDPITKNTRGSELAIPLGFGSNKLGVLDIQSDETNAFSPEDVELLTTLSASISIAIRNANLYDSERWRRDVAESLRDVAVLLSQEVSVDSLMEVILKKLKDLLPCDVASIFLFDDDSEDVSSDERKISLYRQKSTLQGNIDSLDQIPIIQTWYEEATRNDQPVVRKDTEANDPVLHAFKLPLTSSGIAAPLSTAGKQLGLLTLHHHSSRRYGFESQRILASFAGYAAIALDNALLAAESEDQSWISTIMLQVALATQSLTDVNVLTNIIGQLITLLIGGKSGGLLLNNPQESSLLFNSAFGDLDQEQSARLPLQLKTSGIFKSALHSAHPAAYPANQLDKHLSAFLHLAPTDTVLLFPLTSQEEPLGLLMHISSDAYIEEPPEVVLGKQNYAILQGIVHQTATALQNINLVNRRQDQALISHALLQITQTLASSLPLAQSLERLTNELAVLSGAKEIILLEKKVEENCFLPHHIASTELSAHALADLKSRVIKKDQLPEAADFADSPLVLERDFDWYKQLLAYPNAEDKPADRPLIRSDKVLVLPLGVKEEEYGLMLVRLPGTDGLWQNQARNLLSESARLVSVAIQNEHLSIIQNKQQTVERELNLARDIQKTFLPEELPETPGYDIQVSWQTARQVGGDFYDFFTIRPGLLGVVIADVSDKGLAASLYMAVSRTLIRAMALETPQPAATLEKVNRLLQLDSKQGFFVTTFYGQLELATGQFIYSNAGHNPPLLYDAANQRISALNRGGIALGMLEEIALREAEIKLHSGDSLILFTDGVTESINGNGEFYGMKRFTDTLQNALILPPQETMRLIFEDQDRFRGGAGLSDDLTLMIIRRD
ncbi:MAG: GAF domain-containing protein [Anaerolineaceae bacterium]|jgi:sigma-B regulation protein RsbU (phosphoserine phosphatase)